MNIPRWRLYLNAFICLLGILFALPNLFSNQVLEKMPSWFPKEKIPLGLDLQGGSHLVLEMDTKVIKKSYYEYLANSVQEILSKQKIEVKIPDITGDEDVLTLKASESIDGSSGYKIKNIEQGLDISFANDNSEINIKIPEDRLKMKYDESLTKTIEIIQKRIDPQGTKELSVQKNGLTRVILQMPGIQDPEYVKAMLGRTAKMTFHIVDDKLPELVEGDRIHSTFTSVYLPMSAKGSAGKRYIAVKKRSLVNGANLIDAYATIDRDGCDAVHFKFNSLGADEFAVATKRNVGKRLAIVLDNQVITAPNIQNAITGGEGVITGNFTLQEATDLAILLKSGALPAPLTTIEEKTVGPDLGADSIRAGIIATVIAIIVIMAFMLIEYRTFGIAADIALIFNLIFLIASLSCFKFTLTLPGIAGIALTLGMAVDANVLINERIREEIRRGTKVLAAIEFGYSKAIRTIFDSNLTTVFGAIALYIFGSGSVRGFAVTLTLGIGISMFTAISLTKCVKSLYFANKKSNEIIIP